MTTTVTIEVPVGADYKVKLVERDAVGAEETLKWVTRRPVWVYPGMLFKTWVHPRHLVSQIKEFPLTRVDRALLRRAHMTADTAIHSAEVN